jgi:hypothetical protein
MTGGTSTTDDGNVQGEFAVNVKLRQIPTKDKPGTCTSHGGLTQWMASSAFGESDRGGILWNNVMYRVQGSSVYSYTTAGARTKIGTVANDGLRCRLDYSFDFLLIVSAGNLYYYTPNGCICRGWWHGIRGQRYDYARPARDPCDASCHGCLERRHHGRSGAERSASAYRLPAG